MKKHKKLKAFTLLEMLVVLLIIAALILLFVPKLANQRDYAVNTSNQALAKVVKEQYEVYRLEHQEASPAGEKLDQGQLNNLLAAGYLTQAQVSKYEELPDEAFK